MTVSRYITQDELAALKILSDGVPRRPSQLARELGYHSGGQAADLLRAMNRPEVGLVRSQYIKTGNVNDWGLWTITGLGEAELYAREQPQLDFEELDQRYVT